MDGIKTCSIMNQSCYEKIMQLKRHWDEADCTPPTSSDAKGGVYDEMQEIGQAYVELKQAMSELLDCTATFILNADTAFGDQDRAIAQKLAEN